MESLVYSPIEFDNKNSMPDPSVLRHDSNSLIIHPDNVIVRSVTGRVISRYKDSTWDFRHYGGAKIYFNKFGENRSIVKKIIYTFLMMGFGAKSRASSGSSLKTIYNALKSMHQFAVQQIKTLLEVLENKELLLKDVNDLPASRSTDYVITLNGLMEIGQFININVPTDSERYQILFNKMKIKKGSAKQYPIIPPVIFFNALHMHWSNFKIIESNLDAISGFFREYIDNPYFARSKADKSKGRGEKSKLVPLIKAVEKYGLQDVFKVFSIDLNINTFFVQIILTCAHLIAANTGMRKNELQKLTHGCYHAPNKERPAIISGVESKRNGGIDRKQEWITSIDMERVVKLLEGMNKTILKGIKLEDVKNIPLLLSGSIFTSNIREQELVYNVNIISPLNRNPLKIDENKVVLTQEMMDNFLKKTHRPGRWDVEDKFIKVGKAWHFTFHQYRRTFAFLAVNSGMVSLPSLQKQLAHTLMSMSAYYAHGAINIDPIILGKDHVAEEIKKMRDEQTAIAMQLNIKENVRRLKADMAGWANKINNAETDIEERVKLHDELVKESKKGNISMKATPIGFCIKNGPCDSHLTFQFTECGDCDDALPQRQKVLESLSKTEDSIRYLKDIGYEEGTIEMNTQIKEKEYFERQLKKLGENE